MGEVYLYLKMQKKTLLINELGSILFLPSNVRSIGTLQKIK